MTTKTILACALLLLCLGGLDVSPENDDSSELE